MRITVFGAHGSTGRLLTAAALDQGHEVVAVTRRPEEYPLAHPALTVAGADVHHPAAVAGAITGADAVLSTLGVPSTRDPITVYSEGTRTIADAMAAADVKRLVVVSSSATYPHHHADGGFLLNRVLQPLVTRTIGRTTYADMRAMEDLVRDSALAWTVMRPSGLFDLPAPTAYRLDEDEAPGVFTARSDLAASMLEMLRDDRYVGRHVAVTTTEVRPSMLRMMLNEAFG
ncbi:MAG TPA: NAD(P)H-binding protein [Nocardioides sp.]|uniref:NAD(P)-dependent oxidoreductase n=1 Tax=Nocardioides sp. TaxID=35761 RepID=UPI002F3FF75F